MAAKKGAKKGVKGAKKSKTTKGAKKALGGFGEAFRRAARLDRVS
jgi:hypothetical protein